MALRDQPYLPLYVQDFLTDEKLMECSASATGIYIRLLCIMHKSEEYGVILLKQKDKQTDNQIKNFAIKLAKYLPYSTEEIVSGISELLNEGVLQNGGDKLSQKRMIKDNAISIKRAESGKKGGIKTQYAKAKDEAKHQANTETETENDTVNEKNWKNDFDIYLKECKEGYKAFMENPELIKTQQRLNPGVNVKLSIEKGFINFWGTEAGWKHKKKSRSKEIDWQSTIINSIDLNKVYYTKDQKTISEIQSVIIQDSATYK